MSFTQTFAWRQTLGKGEGVHFISGSSNLDERLIVYEAIPCTRTSAEILQRGILCLLGPLSLVALLKNYSLSPDTNKEENCLSLREL